MPDYGSSDGPTKIIALVEKIKKELQCGICLSTVTDPWVTNCDHMFCKCCYDSLQSRRAPKEQRCCPMCKAKLHIRKCMKGDHVEVLVKQYLQLARQFKRELSEFTIPKERQFLESQAIFDPTTVASPVQMFALPKPILQERMTMRAKRRHGGLLNSLVKADENSVGNGENAARNTGNNDVGGGFKMPAEPLFKRPKLNLSTIAESEEGEQQQRTTTVSRVDAEIQTEDVDIGNCLTKTNLKEKVLTNADLSLSTPLCSLFSLLPHVEELLKNNIPELCTILAEWGVDARIGTDSPPSTISEPNKPSNGLTNDIVKEERLFDTVPMDYVSSSSTAPVIHTSIVPSHSQATVLSERPGSQSAVPETTVPSGLPEVSPSVSRESSIVPDSDDGANDVIEDSFDADLTFVAGLFPAADEPVTKEDAKRRSESQEKPTEREESTVQSQEKLGSQSASQDTVERRPDSFEEPSSIVPTISSHVRLEDLGIHIPSRTTDPCPFDEQGKCLSVSSVLESVRDKSTTVTRTSSGRGHGVHVAFTGVDSLDNEVKTLVKEFRFLFHNKFAFTNDVIRSADYLVAMNDERGVIPPTGKTLHYVCAVAAGVPILGRRWVVESLKAKKLLDPMSYATISDIPNEQPAYMQSKNGKSLFAGLRFCLPDKYSSAVLVKRDLLLDVIRLAGGEIINNPEDLHQHDKSFVVFAIGSREVEAAKLLETQFKYPVVQADWVLDSLKEYRLIYPVTEYRVSQKKPFPTRALVEVESVKSRTNVDKNETVRRPLESTQKGETADGKGRIRESIVKEESGRQLSQRSQKPRESEVDIMGT